MHIFVKTLNVPELIQSMKMSAHKVYCWDQNGVLGPLWSLLVIDSLHTTNQTKINMSQTLITLHWLYRLTVLYVVSTSILPLKESINIFMIHQAHQTNRPIASSLILLFCYILSTSLVRKFHFNSNNMANQYQFLVCNHVKKRPYWGSIQ